MTSLKMVFSLSRIIACTGTMLVPSLDCQNTVHQLVEAFWQEQYGHEHRARTVHEKKHDKKQKHIRPQSYR